MPETDDDQVVRIDSPDALRKLRVEQRDSALAVEAALSPDALRALRIGQDYVERAGGREVGSLVVVRRPTKTEFVRTQAPEGASGPYLLYEPRDSDGFATEPYLLAGHLSEVVGEVGVLRELVKTVNTFGETFLWPVPVIGAKPNTWHVTNREAANRAISKWTRMAPNTALRRYQMFEALADLGEPSWSSRPLTELISCAFTGRVITSIDHPVIGALLGRVR